MDSTMDLPPHIDLTWWNVLFAFGFVLFDAGVSSVLGLEIGGGLVTAAVRCVVQLLIMASLLKAVFGTTSPLAVAAIACKY